MLEIDDKEWYERRINFLCESIKYTKSIYPDYRGLTNGYDIIRLAPFISGLDPKNNASKILKRKYKTICSSFDPIGAFESIEEDLSDKIKMNPKASKLIAALALVDNIPFSKKQPSLDEEQIAFINDVVNKELFRMYELYIINTESPLGSLISALKNHALFKQGTTKPIDLTLGYYATKAAEFYQYITEVEYDKRKKGNEDKEPFYYDNILPIIGFIELSLTLKSNNPDDTDLADIFNALREMMIVIKDRCMIKPEKCEEAAKQLLHLLEDAKKRKS